MVWGGVCGMGWCDIGWCVVCVGVRLDGVGWCVWYGLV